MSEKEKRYAECPTCYTLISYLNGVCPECGGTGVVEEKEPQVPMTPPRGKGNPQDRFGACLNLGDPADGLTSGVAP